MLWVSAYFISVHWDSENWASDFNFLFAFSIELASCTKAHQESSRSRSISLIFWSSHFLVSFDGASRTDLQIPAGIATTFWRTTLTRVAFYWMALFVLYLQWGCKSWTSQMALTTVPPQCSCLNEKKPKVEWQNFKKKHINLKWSGSTCGTVAWFNLHLPTNVPHKSPWPLGSMVSFTC